MTRPRYKNTSAFAFKLAPVSSLRSHCGAPTHQGMGPAAYEAPTLGPQLIFLLRSSIPT